MSAPAPARGHQPSGLDVLATIGTAILLYIVGLVIARLLVSAVGRTGISSQFAAVLELAVVAYAMLGAVYVVLIRQKGFAWADLGFAPCDRVWLRRAFMLAALLIPAIFVAAYVLRALVPVDPADDLSRQIAPRQFSWPAGITILLYAGGLAPIAEELIFRGVLFRWLRTRLTWGTAAALSAIAFAILHMQFDAMIVAFCIGMVLAWLYEKSGSLLPSILLHQTINSVQILLVYLFVTGRSGA